ncbi:MAG: hypothetical protein RML94_09870 [Bacteroidia bacterium]|nr:hypothetical protein [Bacteroidia bacterium]
MKKELLKKLLEGKEDPRHILKKYVLSQASSLMGKEMLDGFKDAKASVTVATDDPEKLPEALEKAKEIVESKKLDFQEIADEMLAEKDMEDKKDEDELDLDKMDVDQLRDLLKKLL